MTHVLRPQAYHISFAEYVEHELRSDVKSEYNGGQVLAMSGGSIDHSRIIRNLAGELRSLLRGKSCESFESNLRVYERSFDRGVYPDAQVICGPIEYYPEENTRTTVLNPSVIFEVLSPSTAAYDRGEKMQMYFLIPSLQQYVLVDSTQPHVEIFTRRPDGWLRTAASGLQDTLRLLSVDVKIALSELYLGVEFVTPTVAAEQTPGA